MKKNGRPFWFVETGHHQVPKLNPSFKTNPFDRSGTVAVYLLRHRQDSNLRRHCLLVILSYGLKPAFDSQRRFYIYIPVHFHLSKFHS